MLDLVLNRLRRWKMTTLKTFGASPADLRLTVGDTNPAVARALADAFDRHDAVSVVVGNLLDLDCDAVVSPANSFGDMSGGIDKAIDDFHNGEAQERIRAAIADQHLGEMPVGSSLIVDTASRRLRFVIAAPTMRLPGSVAGSINAYLAMRSALLAILRHNATSPKKIASVAVPGLATGVGGLSAHDSAEQMVAAYESVILGKWREVRNPIQAPFAMRRESR